MKFDKAVISKRITVVLTCLLILGACVYYSLKCAAWIEFGYEYSDVMYLEVPETEMIVSVKNGGFLFDKSIHIFYITQRGYEKPLYEIRDGEVSSERTYSLTHNHNDVDGFFYNKWEITNNQDGSFTISNCYGGEVYENHYLIENVDSDLEAAKRGRMDPHHWVWISMDCIVLSIMIFVLTKKLVRYCKMKRLYKAYCEAAEQSTADTPNNTPPSAEE